VAIARIGILIGAMVLGGCGADVAGTAATSASLQATQVQQGKEQQQQIESRLGEALKAVEASASAPAQ
jgi:hypothetical protein